MIATNRSSTVTSHGGTSTKREYVSYTESIYSLILEGKYQEVVSKLSIQLKRFPSSRPVLSLLAYAYYLSEDYSNAASLYETLSRNYPHVADYKLNLGKSLYKEGNISEALHICAEVNDPRLEHHVKILQFSIRYEQDDIRACEKLLASLDENQIESTVALGCTQYKNGKLHEARQTFDRAMKKCNHFQPDIAYCSAATEYQLQNFDQADEKVNEIVEQAYKRYPDLEFIRNEQTMALPHNAHSKQQTKTYLLAEKERRREALNETCLVEALNLKVALTLCKDNKNRFNEAMAINPDSLYDSEADLDPVTLHNQAISQSEEDLEGTCEKLTFLLENPPYPEQTLGNLTILYCSSFKNNLARKIIEDYSSVSSEYLSSELYTLTSCIAMSKESSTAPLQELGKLIQASKDKLRAFKSQSNPSIDDVDYETVHFLSLILTQTHVYWENQDLQAALKLLESSSEHCGSHPAWNLNMGHVYFALQKYEKAISSYEAVLAVLEDTSSPSAIALGNLCIAYILSNKSRDAENLLYRIEQQKISNENGNFQKKSKQMCVVNLVIGTFYCTQGDYEFGISRVIRAFTPLQETLGTDTWYYAKKCFLSMIDRLSTRMLVLPHSTFSSIQKFMADVGEAGTTIAAVSASKNLDSTHEISTIESEARYLSGLIEVLVS